MMDFAAFDIALQSKENLTMQEVANIIYDAYNKESVAAFLDDMQALCKREDVPQAHKAIAAFGFYYTVSKMDTLYVNMIEKSWNDMLKYI